MNMALAQSPQAEPAASDAQMNIVIVGHVDHGKSTLVGRLLHDTDSLMDGKYEAIKASCEKRGMQFEWAFLMDALQAERDQNVTIDTTQIWFSSALRRYCIIDAPGHREFLKNMITGAASADAALLLIDAKEGVKEQSKRHAYLLHLLGIRQVAVVINKMDAVEYDAITYEKIVDEYSQYLKELDIEPSAFIPISAREGDLITKESDKLPWYCGPSIVDILDQFQQPKADAELPLRMLVQDVYRFDDRRIIAGKIDSGTLNVGDTLHFYPSNLYASVKTIEQWPQTQAAATSASAGEAVAFTLDEQIFVERGQIGCHESAAPVVTNLFKARIFWLSDVPLQPGLRYTLKLGTGKWSAEVKQIVQVMDTGSLGQTSAESVEKYQVAEVLLRTKGMVALDDHQDVPSTGRFVLLDGYDVAGGGIVDASEAVNFRGSANKQIKSDNITAVDFGISRDERAVVNGHKGGVLWFTGLSGSGKSTLAKEVQQRLFAKGYQVYVLDGDNVRRGLCSDLGFAPEDRTENIRRIGEVASLFADAGMIVITAFISPYAEDRRRARAAGPHYFNTIHIKADVDTCESRDVKGLYAKAKRGEIKGFTGVDAPYEAPDNPDLVVDTAANDVDHCVNQLVDYIRDQFDIAPQ